MATVVKATPFRSVPQLTTPKPQDLPLPIDPGIGGYPAEPDITNVYVALTENPSIAISNDVTQAVSDAITSALGASAQQIADAFGGVTSAITDGLSSYIGSLGDFVNSAFGGLGTALSTAIGGIGTAVGDALGTVFSGIKSVLGDIKDAVTNVAGAVWDRLSGIIDAIKAGGVQAIIPVLQAIVTEIQNIRAVILAIHNDWTAGIQSLLLLPTQIHDSLASMEATITRMLQQINFQKGATVNSSVSLADAPIPQVILNQIKGFVSDAGSLPTISSLFPSVPPPLQKCLDPTLNASIQKIQQDAANAPIWVKWIWWVFMDVLIASASVFSLLKKSIDVGDEVANKLCPLAKFDPNSAAQAVLQNYITQGQMNEDLTSQGWDQTHIDVFNKLAIQRLDANTLIDSWYRGHTDVGTRNQGLRHLGFTDEQITTLENNSLQLPSLADILRWKDFNAIDDATFTALAKILRLTDSQLNLIKTTYQTQETTALQIALHGRIDASGKGYAPVSFGPNVPPEVLLAAQRDQLTPGNAKLQWMAHWALPSSSTIIQSYFRLYRTLTDVQSAMTAENIPPEFWDELIKLARPLIPTRSIGSFVNAGVMNPADAILELSMHGFDPLHIAWFMEYIAKSKKPAAASAAASIATLSIATAKELFNDGAITRDQYISVLEAHKFTPQFAALQADADALAFHQKQRKQQITEYIQEVEVGAATVEDILTLMHQQGYTNAEIYSFQSKVARQVKLTAKHPSIAELKSFIKAQLITLDQYKTELQAQGWGDPWLSAFVSLETPPPATATP